MKPRIALLVALSTALGWSISGGQCDFSFIILLAGVTLSSFACGSLNQYRERSVDALMKRTSNRPLPSGLLTPRYALSLGLVLSIAGPTLIFILVSKSAALLTALTIVLYVLAYTPLKRVTPHATWVGAAAGALPPLIGSIAFQPKLSAITCTLFAIQFLWQIPLYS
jgi:protoheme IX farnesyltransferase